MADSTISRGDIEKDQDRPSSSQNTGSERYVQFFSSTSENAYSPESKFSGMFGRDQGV
jgi:hypothetical protein